MLRSIFIYIVPLVCLTGCVKYSNLVYYQQESGKVQELYLQDDYKLRPNDLLNVKLFEPQLGAVESFEGVIGSQSNGGGGLNAAMIYFSGYKIDDSGYLDIPHLDPIIAEGLTLLELEKAINKAYTEKSTYGYYRIRLANMKITVMGEVTRPGVQYIYDTRFTLLQAIANAGNLTIVANSHRVFVFREIEEGKVKRFDLDLAKTDFMSSPAYFLQPYDLIYIEPLKSKAVQANSQTVGTAISTISIVIAVITFFTNVTR